MIDLITGIERLRLGAEERFAPPPGDRPDERGHWNGDAAALEAALRERVRGEVRFGDGDRAMYSTDASNYRQVPIGVVVPESAEDIVATIEVARRFNAPILARGGGTSLAGECCNVAIVLDCSKRYNRILALNAEQRYAVVEPGVVLDTLRDAAKRHGLTYGPDPATHTHNTLGGMIGNNSCGMHAQMAGKVEENILELDVVTYDGVRLTVGETTDAQLSELCGRDDRIGQIYRDLRDLRDAYAERIRERFPNIPRRVSGYNLNELLPENGFNLARALVGTECTCVFVLRATVKLIPNPPKRVILVLGFDDVFAAADQVPLVNTFGPIALEGLDQKLIDYMHVKHLESDNQGLLPGGHGWLMIEFGADDAERAEAEAKRCETELRNHGVVDAKLITDEAVQKRLWEVREAGLGATAKVPGKPAFHPGWEDSAVPVERLGAYLRELRALFDQYGYDPALYGHFGQACIHCRVDFRLSTADGVAAWRAFMNDAAHLIRRYGGSLSGEHGDGQARGEFLPVMYGEEIYEAFRRFKAIWDPTGMMNPGKVVDAYRIDENLREGPHYRPWNPTTRFTFDLMDYGSFAHAANRCVGVGKCRREHGGTMCPSYRVTHEEKHATRGRARLLFEMLEGDPLRDGWRSEAVKEALDLCLACKGCKGDCPVNVDMATYKAEFLSHYYEQRPRPVWAYAFGLIPWWAHLGSLMPRVVNAVAQAPVLAEIAKALAQIAPERHIPPFSDRSFRSWVRGRPRVNAGGPRVILWADTFNNAFHATTAQHAYEVLEAAGYDVDVPQTLLCCGRPLYDYGMIDLAKILVREIIVTLRPDIEAGTRIVGLEPSCVSVFKDELLNLYGDDPDAKRLSDQVCMLGDLLESTPHWTPPKLERRALLHGHCHHKAVLGMDAETRILEKMGLDVQVLDDGCCGMAGAFGFEAGEHYDVSIKVGELAYLPHVRAAAPTDIIVADGFSCREQAVQTTHRQALHLADVVWLAMQEGVAGPSRPYPERAAMPVYADQRASARRDAAVGVAALALAAAGAAFVARRVRR